MPELNFPTTRLHAAWLEARDEWGGGVFQHGSGMSDEYDLDTPEGFADWVELLRRRADSSVPADPGFVHATYWWMIEGDPAAVAWPPGPWGWFWMKPGGSGWTGC